MICKFTRGLETKKNTIYEQGLVDGEQSPLARGRLRCFLTPMQWQNGYAVVISLVVESHRDNNKEYIVIYDRTFYDRDCKDARISDAMRYLTIDTMQEEQARFSVYDIFRYYLESKEEFRKLVPITAKRFEETRERHGSTKDIINEYKLRGAVECPECGKKLVVVTYDSYLACLGCSAGWFVKDYEKEVEKKKLH